MAGAARAGRRGLTRPEVGSGSARHRLDSPPAAGRQSWRCGERPAAARSGGGGPRPQDVGGAAPAPHAPAAAEGDQPGRGRTRAARASGLAPPLIGAATRGTSPAGDSPAGQPCLGAVPRPSVLRGGRAAAGGVG